MPLPRRFDDALMQPPDAHGVVDAVLLASLRAWCEDGALPEMTQALRVARIAPHDGLDAAARVLDGSIELARLGRWRGRAWRLQLLWREQVARRAPRAGDPWDCGWWRPGSLAAARAFRPRRPTLLMLREPDPAECAALLERLHGASPAYSRPLRVLVVSASALDGMPSLG